MAIDLNTAAEHQPSAGPAAGAATHDLDKQRLRILRCTAHAMASSPGGLRFKAGTRPWLEGILAGLPPSAGRDGLRIDAKRRHGAN